MFFVVTEKHPDDVEFIKTDQNDVGGVFCDYMRAVNFLAHPYNGYEERSLYEAKFIHGKLLTTRLIAAVRWNGKQYVRINA